MANIPSLRKLTTQSYEINQIQSYSSNSINQINNSISGLSTQKATISLNSPITLFPAGAVNAYLIFNNVIYDPNNTYNTQNGVFTSPITGLVQVSINITIFGSISKVYQVVGQINKSSISPLASQITNYDFNLCSTSTSSTTNVINMIGSSSVSVNQNDIISIVIYSNTTPITIPLGNYLSQVAFSW